VQLENQIVAVEAAVHFWKLLHSCKKLAAAVKTAVVQQVMLYLSRRFTNKEITINRYLQVVC